MTHMTNAVRIKKPSRREFLCRSAASMSLTMMPTGALAGKGVRYYELKAEPTTHLFDQKSSSTSLWLYNNSSPGPMIVARKGDP